MSELNLQLNYKEERVLEYTDFSDINLTLEEGAKLTLKLANFATDKSLKICGKIKKNAYLALIFADFSNGNSKIESKIDLVEEGAKCEWHLATLSNKKDNKIFDISFNHLVGHTEALMDNYGVARNESKILFTGCNHILEGAKGSNTKQNAKIIVFDKDAQGVASPILRIDENDVQASHGAIVGQLNNEHMFYLMSRGLTREEARMIITLGYLKPVSSQFSEETQLKIENILKEAM